jgi:hypothetical protein
MGSVSIYAKALTRLKENLWSVLKRKVFWVVLMRGLMRPFGNILLSRCCKGWGDWGPRNGVRLCYPEGFKKNTE